VKNNTRHTILTPNLFDITVNESPKSTITSLKSEKAKKVKRLSSDHDNKRYRATFDKAQIFHMERVFLINHYPDVASRSELSKATGLSESQVQVSFLAFASIKQLSIVTKCFLKWFP